MPRSNFTDPLLKVAQRVTRFGSVRVLAQQGRSGGADAPTAPAVGAALQTRRAGDGTAANPYRTRHAMMWDIENWNDPESFWVDAPPVTP